MPSSARANSTAARTLVHITKGAAILAGALSACAAVRRLASSYTRLEVEGDSMQPALQPGDWLIARHLDDAAMPNPGDIVVVRDPRDGRSLVKRVDWCDKGYVSLIGDNREQSRDSRHFGPLEATAVESQVIYRYWPPRRIGRIK